MDRHRATMFVEELALVLLGTSLPERRKAYYVEALLNADDRCAEEAFRMLIQKSRKFPTIAEILETFGAVSEELYGTRDVRRSSSSPDYEVRQRQTIRSYLDFEPVMYHPDLYHRYVDAHQEVLAGKRTPEQLRALRQELIAEARKRTTPQRPPDLRAKAPTPDAQLSGLDASIPTGDR